MPNKHTNTVKEALYQTFLRLFHEDITDKERQRIAAQLDIPAYYALLEHAQFKDDISEEDFRRAHAMNEKAIYHDLSLRQRWRRRLLARLGKRWRGSPGLSPGHPLAEYLSIDNYVRHFPFRRKSRTHISRDATSARSPHAPSSHERKEGQQSVSARRELPTTTRITERYELIETKSQRTLRYTSEVSVNGKPLTAGEIQSIQQALRERSARSLPRLLHR